MIPLLESSGPCREETLLRAKALSSGKALWKASDIGLLVMEPDGSRTGSLNCRHLGEEIVRAELNTTYYESVSP